MENTENWRFGVVGNIIGAHKDSNGNVYYGTKAFTPGTKVYLDGKYWSKEHSTINVIGHNRFGRTVCESVDVNLIENVRAKRIFNPQILEMLDYFEVMEGWDWWGQSSCDRKGVKQFIKDWANKESPVG